MVECSNRNWGVSGLIFTWDTHCVVSLSKTLYPLLSRVLVQPRRLKNCWLRHLEKTQTTTLKRPLKIFRLYIMVITRTRTGQTVSDLPNVRYMSCDMGFPTMWYVRPAKPQISLRIRAVWSEPLLVVFILWVLSYWLNTSWSLKA